MTTRALIAVVVAAIGAPFGNVMLAMRDRDDEWDGSAAVEMACESRIQVETR
jgi:hypothetical protein